MTKVLFACQDGGHAEMVLPVAQQMLRLGGWQPLSLGPDGLRSQFEQQGIRSFGFPDLFEHSNEELTGAQALNDRSDDEYSALCLRDLELRLGQDAARALYESQGDAALTPLPAMRRWLARTQPDLVIATSSPHVERCTVLAAQEMGIPSAIMIDLGGLQWDFLADRDCADRVLVMNSTVRDAFVSRGRRPEQLVVTGNPALDFLADPQHATIAAAWRESRGWQACRVILWVDELGDRSDARAEVLRQLVLLAHQHLEYRIAYRPDPTVHRPSGADVPEVLTRLEPEMELATALQLAEVVVATDAVCGVKAALLDKPVVHLSGQFGVTGDPRIACQPEGMVLPVETPGDLNAAIEKSLRADSLESIGMRTARQQLPLAGTAAKRVVEAMLDLCASIPFTKSYCHRRFVA